VATWPGALKMAEWANQCTICLLVSISNIILSLRITEKKLLLQKEIVLEMCKCAHQAFIH
jgi:hypothetical protein